jgi:hypothetical protein
LDACPWQPTQYWVTKRRLADRGALVCVCAWAWAGVWSTTMVTPRIAISAVEPTRRIFLVISKHPVSEASNFLPEGYKLLTLQEIITLQAF